jgi:hypothetical protein
MGFPWPKCEILSTHSTINYCLFTTVNLYSVYGKIYINPISGHMVLKTKNIKLESI